MRELLGSEVRKIASVRGRRLLLAAGPLIVVAGVTGLVASGGNVRDPAEPGRALAHVGLAAIVTLLFGVIAVAGEYRSGSVMATRAPAPRAGSSTVAQNLREFIEAGLRTLAQVAPAFAGLVSEPGVMTRFHALVGGDAAFGADMPGPGGPAGAEGSGSPQAGQPQAGPAGSTAGAVTCPPSSTSAGRVTETILSGIAPRPRD